MGKSTIDMVNKLMAVGNLRDEELKELLQFRDIETTQYLHEQARLVREKQKKGKAQIWGRIPISNYCKYDCKMCGLRRDNQFAKRYRMDMDHILRCCYEYQKQGVHGFVLESGDDLALREQRVAEIILTIRGHHPKTKIILALGEKTDACYAHWKHVGADGYILHHGSANEGHYRKIYPSNMSLLIRKQCQWQIRNHGYLAGDGFLVGIPYQMVDNVVEDIRFIKEYMADIIDIGAFIPGLRTPFERERSGNGDMTMYIMAILRLMLPNASILANPTLDCVLKEGRMNAFDAGADVVLVDIDEREVMDAYCVYPHKSGRMQLPMDVIDEYKIKIQEKGLVF